MDSQLHRRAFLQTSTLALFAAASGAGLSDVQGAEKAPPRKGPAEDFSGLTAYQLGPQIWIRLDNRPLTCYRAHRSQKYPYFYPLTGPLSGLPLTDETTLPYPHHRSLFFACDRVNGGNYWQEGYETGQILSSGPKLEMESKEKIVIADRTDWQKPGGPVVMRDSRQLTITAPSAEVRFVDWEIQWTAVENVTVVKTNHSLFSIRAALDITPKGGGNLMNAEGETGEKGTYGKKSAWCGFYGKRAQQPGVTEGIAIFDHPKNPWAPTPWFTRDYGFASPTPLYFVETDWKLPAGESVNLKYRVVLHAGDPGKANLAGLYKQWAV
jgi:hypothetical protein